MKTLINWRKGNMESNTTQNTQNEKNKVTVSDLVNRYKSYSSAKAKSDYLVATVKITPYVSYATKIFFINEILKLSCFDKKGNLQIDSTKRYLLYIKALFDGYTNIRIDPDDVINQYDRLDSSGILQEVLKMIPENEIKTFDTMLKMRLDDTMTNYYDIHSYIDRKIQGLYPFLGDSLSKFLEAAEKALNNLDENKIEKILKKITN